MRFIQYHPLEQRNAIETVPVQIFQRERRRRWILSIITGVECFLLTAAVVTLVSRQRLPCDCVGDTRRGFPPAESSLQFETKLFLKYGVRTSATAQDPGPKLDAAWHDLLSGMTFKVSEKELRSVTGDVQSVALADGTGFIASMEVYHELHCVKLLKHWLHRDYYLAGWNDTQVQNYWSHLNHCLDWLKEAAICRGETTLTTYVWNHSELQTEYPIPYRCVQPDSLLTWTQDRVVDVGVPGTLVGPWT